MSARADQYAEISFGRFLQKLRLEKRIRLDDVAQQTRIRTQILLAIEKEEHDKLPAKTYVKGFLVAFAKAVGADANEVLRRYERDCREFDKMARYQFGQKKSSVGDWLKLGSVLGLLLILVSLSVYLMTFVAGKIDPETGTQKELVGETSHRSDRITGLDESEEAFSNGQNNKAEISPKAGDKTTLKATIKNKQDEKIQADTKDSANSSLNANGYLLSVHAVKNTWLKVITDDQEMVKYSLKTGDRLDLAAVSRFNILIGNAEGVQITLNDRPFPVSGKSGQIVNIDIP